MVLTAESGWSFGECGYGPDRKREMREAINAHRVENGKDPIDWSAEGFPAPVARVTSKHPLYDWEEVAGWLVDRDALPREELVRARVVKEANLHLEANNAPDNFVRRLEALESA